MKRNTEKSILNPAIIYFLVSVITFSNYIIKPDMRLFPQRAWLPDIKVLEILVVATLAGFLGIVFGKYTALNRKSDFTKLEQEIQAKTIDRFGSLFFYISCFGYLIWILSDLNGWFNYQTTGHLRTIPGVTTLTQLMSVAIV